MERSKDKHSKKSGFERKLNNNGKQNPKYVDLLEEDKPISAQKFVCVSFVSPEKILKQKEVFFFEEFLKKWDFNKSMEKFIQFLSFISYKYNISFDDLTNDYKEFVKEEKDNLTKSSMVDDFKTFLDNNEEELEKVKYEDLSCLLYTSGTTGKPKGAMLTHNNFMSNIVMADLLLPIVTKDFTFLSFLPLCHVYERTCTYYFSTYKGFKVAFAQSLEALTTNIQEVQPRAILTVPRLLERIEERVRKSATSQGGFKLKIFKSSIK
jgi:long-subunit acyl-CoA synthetase (AMP-forming)